MMVVVSSRLLCVVVELFQFGVHGSPKFSLRPSMFGTAFSTQKSGSMAVPVHECNKIYVLTYVGLLPTTVNYVTFASSFSLSTRLPRVRLVSLVVEQRDTR